MEAPPGDSAGHWHLLDSQELVQLDGGCVAMLHHAALAHTRRTCCRPSVYCLQCVQSSGMTGWPSARSSCWTPWATATSPASTASLCRAAPLRPSLWQRCARGCCSLGWNLPPWLRPVRQREAGSRCSHLSTPPGAFTRDREREREKSRASRRFTAVLYGRAYRM
jgi:hypothetical protein